MIKLNKTYYLHFSDGKRRRFKGWNNFRRIFQRKSSRSAVGVDTAGVVPSAPASRSQSTRLLSGLLSSMGSSSSTAAATATAIGSRSRSTSELLQTSASQPHRQSLTGSSSAAAYSIGLSLSHESVFDLEASPASATSSQSPFRPQNPHSSMQYLARIRQQNSNHVVNCIFLIAIFL